MSIEHLSVPVVVGALKTETILLLPVNLNIRYFVRNKKMNKGIEQLLGSHHVLSSTSVDDPI